MLNHHLITATTLDFITPLLIDHVFSDLAFDRIFYNLLDNRSDDMLTVCHHHFGSLADKETRYLYGEYNSPKSVLLSKGVGLCQRLRLCHG